MDYKKKQQMWNINAPDVCLSRDLSQQSVRYQRSVTNFRGKHKWYQAHTRLEFAQLQTVAAQDSELPTTSHQQQTNTCLKNRFLRLSVIQRNITNN
jgi:hypothetical protein